MASTPGVEAAQVAMATDLNTDVIASMGFTIPSEAGPNDLVVAIRGADEGLAAGRAALDTALAELKSAGAHAGGFGEAPPRRTLGGAISASEANLALVSVPGQHATVEALDAIHRGVSVMLFSDNVPVEDEVRLKDAAAAADVLVMGPDCGTAVVGGVALGFANAVRHGRRHRRGVGTGAQQVMCLLDAADVGVSHCLGVGGRDLSAAVSGRSTKQALAALAADEATTSVIVVSKLPADEVLADLQAYAAGLGACPLGHAGRRAPDLTAAVESALEAEGHGVPQWPSWWSTRQPPPARACAGSSAAGPLPTRRC